MIDVIRDHNGVERKLGWVRPSPETRKLRASRTNIQTWRANAGQSPLIPRSEWQPVDFVDGAPLSLIEDQRSYGSCTAATATGAGNRQRWMRGQAYVPLSWAWLYDQINGGRDAGSNIGDAGSVIRAQGVPPMSSYPDCTFRAGHNPSGVLYYKEGAVEITLSTFEEMATALLMSVLPQFAFDAGGAFERFSGDGVSQGTGGNPNHSVYAAGLKQIAGKWCLRLVNSWRAGWGPFQNGTCYVTETAVNNCAGTDDSIGHIIVEQPKGAT